MEDLATDETEHDFRPQPRPQLSTTQQNRISDSAAAQNFRGRQFYNFILLWSSIWDQASPLLLVIEY